MSAVRVLVAIDRRSKADGKFLLVSSDFSTHIMCGPGGGVYLFLDCLSIPLHLQSMTRPLTNVGVHSYIVIADK